jgi:hypothetical protein
MAGWILRPSRPLAASRSPDTDAWSQLDSTITVSVADRPNVSGA